MVGAIARVEGTNRSWNQANPNPSSYASAEKLPENMKAGQATSELAIKEDANKESFIEGIEKLNEQMKATNKALRFKYSEDAGKYYVQIIDARSQEVIESVPPEYLLELASKLKDLLGLFIDRKL